MPNWDRGESYDEEGSLFPNTYWKIVKGKNIPFCRKCNKPKSKCVCKNNQSGE